MRLLHLGSRLAPPLLRGARYPRLWGVRRSSSC